MAGFSVRLMAGFSLDINISWDVFCKIAGERIKIPESEPKQSVINEIRNAKKNQYDNSLQKHDKIKFLNGVK